MAAVRKDPVLRFIRKLAVRDRAVHLTDCELLQSFLTRHEEDAFAALVCRHGAMVLRVCLNVLHNEQDAEDAFQATFLVLSRKAASVKKQQSVGSWLFGVAQHVSSNLQRSRGRQRTRDSRVGQSKTVDPLADISVREAQAILYEELNRLSEKYRSPLVLCTLEGMTRDEAAHHLGLPLHKLKNRLEWRKRLRERLTARGVGLLGALIGSVFCEQAVSAAVPMALLASTINAATTVAAGGAATSVVSAKVAALTEGVMKAMLMSKLKSVSAVVLVLGFIVTGMTVLSSRTAVAQDDKPPIAEERVKSPPKQQPKGDKDLAELEGKWDLVSEEHDGKSDPLMFKSYHFTFKGKEVTTAWVREDDSTGGVTMQFVIDSTKNPKELTLTNANIKILSVYKQEKDQLTMAFFGKPEDARPKGFTAANSAADGRILVVRVLKRAQQPNPLPKVPKDFVATAHGGPVISPVTIKDVTIDQVDEAGSTISVSFGDKRKPTRLVNVPLGKGIRVVASHVRPGSVNNLPFEWDYVKRLQGKIVSVRLDVAAAGMSVVSIASGND